MGPSPQRIKIGTRGSKLARWQADWVKAELCRRNPQLQAELVIIKTEGDKILDTPLAKIGGKGLFVKEIETALLEGRIDVAVHSIKDMPAEIPDGLCLGAIPPRETPLDALISKNGSDLKTLFQDARVGTSSLRRGAQLRHLRPDLNIMPLRGNLDTRLRKLESEDLDALVVAAAGLKRLGLEKHITQTLEPGILLPAVGQGALGVEVRTDDDFMRASVQALDDPETHMAVLGERAFLHRLQGGCQVPIAALGQIHADRFYLSGLVADLDGATLIKESIEGLPAQSEALGIELAEQLLARGADAILEKLLYDATPSADGQIK